MSDAVEMVPTGGEVLGEKTVAVGAGDAQIGCARRFRGPKAPKSHAGTYSEAVQNRG